MNLYKELEPRLGHWKRIQKETQEGKAMLGNDTINKMLGEFDEIMEEYRKHRERINQVRAQNKIDKLINEDKRKNNR